MKRWLKILLLLMSLSLIIVPVVYASYLYATTKGAIDNSFLKADKKSDLRDKEVDPAMDHVSILFLGIDDSLGRRKNGQKVSQSRTDAMILATFNRSDKQIRLVSIPRDTLAYIPAVGYYDKITHAHADGGPTSSMESVEQLFNVPVDYYARVNMQAFVDIVDELGGIEFNVPFDMDEPTTNDKGRIKIKKGHRLLTGDEALALVRSRHVDTDLGRGKRQMEMIEAIVKKAKQTNSLSKLDELISIVGNNAKHNLTFENITSLATYYSSNDVEFKRMQLKGTDYMYNGVYYYNPVFDHIFTIANLLRKDLELPEIKRSELLDYKMISVYDDLIPLQTVDLDELEKAYKEKKSNNDEKAQKNISEESTKTTESQPTTESQYIPEQPVTTETVTNEYRTVEQQTPVFESPATEAPTYQSPRQSTQSNYQNTNSNQTQSNDYRNNQSSTYPAQSISEQNTIETQNTQQNDTHLNNKETYTE